MQNTETENLATGIQSMIFKMMRECGVKITELPTPEQAEREQMKKDFEEIEPFILRKIGDRYKTAKSLWQFNFSNEVEEKLIGFLNSSQKFLLLLGGTGTAKTCIAKILMEKFLQDEFKKIKNIFQVLTMSQYIRAIDFFDELKKTFDERDATTQLINWTSGYKLLIIDEIGATHGTINEVVNFNRLCDNYYKRNGGKMVLISNCTETEIHKYISLPAYSRICESGLIVNIQTGDYRKNLRTGVIIA